MNDSASILKVTNLFLFKHLTAVPDCIRFLFYFISSLNICFFEHVNKHKTRYQSARFQNGLPVCQF